MMPIEKILDAPIRTVDDIAEIKQILPNNYVYVNVRRDDIAKYSREIEEKGFKVGLFVDVVRPELKGAYVLEVI